MSPQIVLMTGCSSGIGLATAKLLALDTDQRYIVIATVIEMSAKTDLEAAVKGALDRTVFIEKMDVTNDEEIGTVVDGTLRKYGRIDVLLNVAGIVMSGIPEYVTRERMEQIFNVNVFGVIRLTQAVLPLMKTTKTGKIIIVSSAWGKMASPYAEVYCSTKFAVEGYFEGLAAALRSFNIRVCLVEPGKVSTGFVDQFHVGLVSGAQDDTVYDIDRRQLRHLNDHVKAAPGVTPDAVADAIKTRCLDVDEPVLRHLLPVEVRDAVPAVAANITGETVIGILRKSIGN
ncbi:retinol dehydrogenase 8-like [Strongylocentrotus purpuratus]|uniref:Retinol dehydrogenase 8 n=1 Tax=Strongylocentrotus purpuratus TaxID=7668 RepID=A0A7M7LW66_STRPU|nr:retinol dehydrogenase 8-like [Strongylocentrotus purpuratus]|eukprot:XP_011674309.1 PREDICTED: retinol dehydrogenase 8-like [Strongylocentrotus purpuratus]